MELSDAGRYYCTVSNQAGSDHRGLDLRVFGKVLVLYSTLLLDLQGFNPFKTLLMKYFLSAIIDRKNKKTNKSVLLRLSESFDQSRSVQRDGDGGGPSRVEL